jgi:hypothetical protein
LPIVVFLYYSLPVICRRNKFKAVFAKLFSKLLKDCWGIIIRAGDVKRLFPRSAELKTASLAKLFSAKHMAGKLKIGMRFKPQPSGVIHRAIDDLLGIVDPDSCGLLILVTSREEFIVNLPCGKTFIAKGVFKSQAENVH